MCAELGLLRPWRGVAGTVPPRVWELRQASLPGTLGFLGSVPAQSKGVARLVGTGHSFYVLGSRAGLGLIHSWRTHTHTHLIALLQSKVFWRRVMGESEALTAGAAAV